MQSRREQSAVLYFSFVAGIAAAIAIFANYMIEISQRDVLVTINNISRSAIPISLQNLKTIKAMDGFVAAAEVAISSTDKRKATEALGLMSYILNTSDLLINNVSSSYVSEINKLIEKKEDMSSEELDMSWSRLKGRVAEYSESATNNSFKDIDADLYEASDAVELMRYRIRLMSLVVMLITVLGVIAVYLIFISPLTYIEGLAKNYTYGDEGVGSINNYIVSKVRELHSLRDAIKSLYVTMQDNLTIKKSLEEQVKKTSLIAEEKSDFLASMSHEIRTPLSSITGMIYMLESSGLNDEQEKFTTLLAKSCHHLNQIVTRSLDVSRINANKLDLIKEEFVLPLLIYEVADMVRPVCEKKLIEVHVDIDESAPYVVSGDPVRLKEILINYLNNAIKFTKKGRIEINIRCLSIRKGSVELKIEVKDTGVGIKADDIPFLFKRFSQSGSRRFAGSGLGLSITDGLAKLMGGTVGVQSVFGEGSIFWATVVLELVSEKSPAYVSNFSPLESAVSAGEQALLVESLSPDDVEMVLCQVLGLAQRDAPEALQLWLMHEDALRRAIGITATLIGDCIRAFQMPGVCELINGLGINCEDKSLDCVDDRPCVLIVDDTPHNLEFISFLIGDLAQVRVASSAYRGIEILQSGVNIALVVMDVSMPEVSGLDVLAIVRSNAETSAMPILMISASSDHEMEEKCILLGASEYFDRGNPPEQLKKIVAKYLHVKDTGRVLPG